MKRKNPNKNSPPPRVAPGLRDVAVEVAAPAAAPQIEIPGPAVAPGAAAAPAAAAGPAPAAARSPLPLPTNSHSYPIIAIPHQKMTALTSMELLARENSFEELEKAIAVTIAIKQNARFSALQNLEIQKLQQEKIEIKQALEAKERELIELRRQLEASKCVSQRVEKAVTCPICNKVALLPKVVGDCGHIACEPCLSRLVEKAFAALEAIY